MKTVVLTRKSAGDQGTFGVMKVDDDHAFFTGELPDRDNAANISRIPAGTYECRWTHSAHFCRSLYEVTGVEGRAGVRIHSANFMGDASKKFFCQLNGCIALGKKLGVMDGQKAVLLSAQALREFEDLMERKPFKLEVRDEST